MVAGENLGQSKRIDMETRSFLERNFLWILLAIAFASLIPRLILGASQFIHYDAYWHIFIATQDRWKFFWVEVRDNAHPPLFYLLLRFASKLGHSHLVYRAIGIGAGAGAAYVLGLIAAKVCRNRAVALLAAAAYGFAMTIIDLTIDVRSYPIAILFTLLAFHAYLDYLAAPLGNTAPRAIARFGAFAALAILSEYYAVFFLAACVVTPLLRALADREFGRNLLVSVKRFFGRWALTFAGLAVLMATLYVVHLQYQPAIENNVGSFYWDPQSKIPIWRFLIDNLRLEVNFFFPLSIGSYKKLFFVLLAFVPAVVYLVFFRKGSSKNAIAAMPPAILSALICELMILSVAGRYPFGGELRQQSIIAPFFILTGFVVLDWVITVVRNRFLRAMILTVILALIVVNFNYRWKRVGRVPQELASRQYDAFHSVFPHPPVIFTDQFSVILLFTHNHDSQWFFDRRYGEKPMFVYTYRTKDASGQPVEIVRDHRVWNFDMANPVTYQWLADSFRMVGLRSATLFAILQFGTPLQPAQALAAEEQYRKLARQAGLTYGRSFFDGTAAFVEFELAPEPRSARLH